MTMRATRLLALAVAIAAAPHRLPAQMLETETARVLPRGAVEVGGAFELQRSGDGREAASPLAVEVGIAPGLELVVEPVPYTAIRPRGGHGATAPGDLEVTAVYLLRRESRHVPALAVGAEVKVPTSHDPLISTGATDYTGYVIASRSAGPADLHLNLGYSILGRPAGPHLRNILSGAAAAVLPVARSTEMFAEVLGNTASGPDAEGSGGVPTAAEAPGGELVGTIGVGRRVGTARLYAGVSYDNNAALQLRTGVTLRVR
jgi:hypothetical protein